MPVMCNPDASPSAQHMQKVQQLQTVFYCCKSPNVYSIIAAKALLIHMIVCRHQCQPRPCSYMSLDQKQEAGDDFSITYTCLCRKSAAGMQGYVMQQLATHSMPGSLMPLAMPNPSKHSRLGLPMLRVNFGRQSVQHTEETHMLGHHYCLPPMLSTSHPVLAHMYANTLHITHHALHCICYINLGCCCFAMNAVIVTVHE